MSEVALLVAEQAVSALQACRVDGRRCLILGLCGAQGSGKSTVARTVASNLRTRGLKVALLSLDDLYLDPAARAKLAMMVHPLLRTRGVPGTHDVQLGAVLLDRLVAGLHVRLPRFDKARDAPVDPDAWDDAGPGTDVILFEGWCVGATPQADAALSEPINALEAQCDADGRWRRYVNTALAGGYQGMFGRIDSLILLAAPAFSSVYGWRLQQEQELRTASRAGRALMNDAEVARFIQHYERLTRHVLDEMPSRAEMVIRLKDDRRVARVERASRLIRYDLARYAGHC